AEPEHAQNVRGDVEIDDPIDGALVQLIRERGEDGVHIPGQKPARGDRQSDNDFFRMIVHPTRTVSTKTTASTVKIISKATRKRMPMPRGCPARRSVVSVMAAIS